VREKNPVDIKPAYYLCLPFLLAKVAVFCISAPNIKNTPIKYVATQKIVLILVGYCTPNPVAIVTGIIQYINRAAANITRDPTEAICLKLESGYNKSLSSQKMPYVP